MFSAMHSIGEEHSIIRILVLSLVMSVVTCYVRQNAGLTEIPSGIACTEIELYLQYNHIRRVEADDFLCLSQLSLLDLEYNHIEFISATAFDPLFSLEHLWLRGNMELEHLPVSYGPNTANMKAIWLKHMATQISDNYLSILPSLREMDHSFAVGPDFYAYGNNLRMLYHLGGPAPYLTGHVPKLTYLGLYGDEDLPDDNLRYMTSLKTFEVFQSCKNIPSFEGAVSLDKIKIWGTVRDIPDLTHLTSLTTLDVDMRAYECSPKTCWMLFESLTRPVLSWLLDAICRYPEILHGVRIGDLSPLSISCFQG